MAHFGSEELKERTSNLSDEELLRIVEVEAFLYRQEVLGYAKDELRSRGIEFQEAREPPEKEVSPVISYSHAPPRRLVSCKNIAEAGLLKAVLAESGIVCEIRHGYLSMASGAIPFTECYPEIWLASEEDFERAKEIIEEWRSKEFEVLESWTCKGCGEENEGQFGACWRCGRIKRRIQ